MKETAVEARLIKRAKAAGGICMKVMPVVAGYPDRLLLLPDGRLYMIETKAPGGALRPAQRVFKDRAAKVGVTVYVLSSTKEVDAWMDEHI